MAREPFLINPPRRGRKRRIVKRKRHTNSWFGEIKRHSAAAKRGARKRVIKKRKHKKNFLGEEVLIVGANPRRRKRNKVHRRKRHYALANPVRHHRRRRHNPVRKRRHARRRRNPIEMSFKNPKSFIMPIAAGLAGKWASDKIPAMLGTTFSTGYMKIAAQAAIAFGGGMLLKRFVGKDAAQAFTLVAGVNAAIGLFDQFVPGLFSGYSGGFGSLGYTAPIAHRMPSARQKQGYDAFPTDFSAFPYETAGSGGSYS